MTQSEASKLLGVTQQAIHERVNSSSDATRVIMKFFMSYSLFEVEDRLTRLQEWEEKS